jgi:23S rRNA pseudouridine1911/1915/1917 synthase
MSDLHILFEDNHLVAVNKRAGVLVQGDVTGDVPLSELVKEYVKKKYNKPRAVFLGVVHRLDRPVSGVVVFARTSKSLERMNELFRNRETKKIYHAIVQGKPAVHSGTLTHWLVKDESRNKTTAYKKEHEDGLRSELSYELVRNSGGRSLLEVHPVTGRPHQIRVQLSVMGCPIVGDVKYGAGEPNDDASICLHASKLHFVHPVRKEEVTIEAPFPENHLWDDFRQDYLASL